MEVEDLNKKEYLITRENTKTFESKNIQGFIPYEPDYGSLFSFSGEQVFIPNVMSPSTPVNRLLLEWMTGVGKTNAILLLYEEFVKYIKKIPVSYKEKPSVFIIASPSVQLQIKNILISTLYFGFITKEEINHMLDLQSKARDNMSFLKVLSGFRSTLFRKLSNKSDDGYFTFYGYREFIGKIINITKTGEENNVSLVSVRGDNKKNLNEQLEKGYISLNYEILDQIRNGLIVVDEAQNLYNIESTNNYGAVIQYVLDTLEKTGEPAKAVFLSATPMTGAASEILDILNLLISDSSLDRRDFFNPEGKPLSGAIKKIGELSRGRISFVCRRPLDFPERVFIGEQIEGIKYLHFITCPATEAQRIKYDDGETIQNYDIVGEPNVENINLYSSKYSRFLSDLKELEGKVMIWHYLVKSSGIMFIYELLKNQGIITHGEYSTDETPCAICWVNKKDHGENHIYYPARVVMLHGDMDTVTRARYTFIYNSPENTDGSKIKIILTSRMATEGIEFLAVRNQIILHTPTDISSLIQIFGRVIRRKSHALISDITQRKVEIRIYVTTKNEKSGYELEKYKRMMDEYMIIQDIEKELRSNAFDNSLRNNLSKNDIDIVEFAPIYKPPEKMNLNNLSYFAYGHANKEIEIIERIIIELFNTRTVWKIDDLRSTIKQNGSSIGYDLDSSLFNDDIINMAISNLGSRNRFHIGRDKKQVRLIFHKTLNGEIFIFLPSDGFVDFDSFCRTKKIGAIQEKRISMEKYISLASVKDVENELKKFEEFESRAPAESDILELISYPEDELELLARTIIEKSSSNYLPRLKNICFKIGMCFRNGYMTSKFIYEYDNGLWTKKTKPLEKKIEQENHIIIGFIHEQKFKVRPPRGKKVLKDQRFLEKGVTCKTKSKRSVAKLALELGIPVEDKQFLIPICEKIAIKLISNELDRGSDDPRWFYFPYE